MFSFEPRYHGLWGAQKYTFMPVASVKSACFDFPVPRSQVSERDSSDGRVRILLASARATVSESFPRTFTSIVNRELRSTRVAM